MDSYKLSLQFKIVDNKHEVSSVTLNTFIESYKAIFEEMHSQKIKINNINPTKANNQNIINIDIERESLRTIMSSINSFIVKIAECLPASASKKGIKEKNALYQQLIDDENILAFQLGDHPLIPRADFPKHITAIEDPFYCGVYEITVSSPVWYGPPHHRHWQGNIVKSDRLSTTQQEYLNKKNQTSVTFKVEEASVKAVLAQYNTKAVTLTPKDTLSAQVIFCPDSHPQYQIISILSYNRVKISGSLSSEKIQEKIDSQKIRASLHPNQPELF